MFSNISFTGVAAVGMTRTLQDPIWVATATAAAARAAARKRHAAAGTIAASVRGHR
ncbi:hypothetical protein JDV09_22930 [Mycobacterium sp. Y57]|uniref:hypothetical protein n=1 Tax=Mycolicibacterium xanthum TaxID=2796469 RepID=UPI001C84440F|nr:hypothetical protein [Mycolicibacterium xanthum]MBX7434925.1 hypothetical protein [Mycolicibacterium xanthum]